jgi:hypothetical protein
MKLNLLERFNIQRILPQETNFLTLKIVNSLKQSLSPSEEELKEFDVKPEVDSEGRVTGRITWNELGKEEREIEIGEKATDLIVESLKKLDKENKITNEHYTIYEKFIK